MTVEKLYKQHGEELEYAIVAFCQNKELAKDVKQQAFLKALMNRQNLENMPEQAAKAWLFATARNDIIDQMRKVKRLVLTGEIQWFEKEGTNEFTQFEMKSLVDQLPCPQQEIVILRYWNGYNASQIGQMLKMEPSTVRYHLSRAIKMLKEKLKED